MSSQNKMSKGDSPSDFNADEVVEYLETADDEEKQRVAQEEEQGKNRSTVLRAAESGSSSDDTNDNSDSGDDTPATATDNGVSESEDVEASSNTDEQRSVAAESAPKAGDQNYSPYNDPDVPSSAVADNIVIELAESGESPTLNAIKETKDGENQVKAEDKPENQE